MDISTIVTSIIALAAVVIGAKLQSANMQNLKLREALNGKKQKVYRGLLTFLDDVADEKISGEEIVDTLKKHMSDLLFYAPSGVIKSFGDVMQHIYSTTDEGHDDTYDNLRTLKLLAELRVQIRKDLGNTKSESWIDILRLTINDINQYIPQANRKDRGKKTLPHLVYRDKHIT